MTTETYVAPELTAAELAAWVATRDVTGLEGALGPEAEWCDGRAIDCAETMLSQLAAVCGYLRSGHPFFRRLLVALAHDEGGTFSHVEVQAEARSESGTLYIGSYGELEEFFPIERDGGRQALGEVIASIYERYVPACRAAQLIEGSRSGLRSSE